MEQTVTIFLTPIDAELFKKFQKHHMMFKFLVEKGVFDQKNASIVLNFDEHGQIGGIDRHDNLYSKRHEIA